MRGGCVALVKLINEPQEREIALAKEAPREQAVFLTAASLFDRASFSNGFIQTSTCRHNLDMVPVPY